MVIILKIYFNGGKNIFFPDLSGKIVVITGANTGIGFIAAQEMAKLNPTKIIFACRSEERGMEAIAKIRGANPSKDSGETNMEFMKLDLNDLVSVQAFATAFNAKYERLDILLNNAGIMMLPERGTTA